MATVAQQLRDARETAGLTVKQVADSTQMRTDHVYALEEGNYDAFVAPVYIRGFVRTYARVVRLEEGPLLAALDAELGQTERFREHPSLTGGRKGALDSLMLLFSRIHWRIVLPVIGILLVLLVALFIERSVRTRRIQDPLTGVGPGLYQPSGSPGGETLSIPTNTPPRR